MVKIEPVKGTRDFYPELMSKINYIFNSWKKVCMSFGYEEFDGPLLEPAKLWQLKSGEEIPDQMYVFKDKGGREIAIRPELTPTLARMIAAKQKALSKPIKWFSVPRCSRYERAQKGRLREFFQLNVDTLGTDDVFADAENIAIAIEIMLDLGFTKEDFYVRISNRMLLDNILTSIGVKDTKEVFRLIDKKSKIGDTCFEEEISKLIKSTGLLNEFLSIESLDSLLKFIQDNKIKVDPSDLKQLFKYLNDYSDYIKFDPSITRGFDYYTGTVFEVFDKSLKFRAIAGGGRYDNLVEDFGGEKISGVGFGMGDVVLSLFMEEKGLMPEYKKDYDYYVTIIPEKDLKVNQDLKSYAFEVSKKLRINNKVFLELNEKKLNKALKFANANSISKVVIVGITELQNKTYILKDMIAKSEESIDFSQD